MKTARTCPSASPNATSDTTRWRRTARYAIPANSAARPTAKPEVILGGPAHTLDLQAFQAFLYDCAADPRFTPDNVMAAIAKVHQFSWTESLVYRFLIIPGVKKGLAAQKAAYAWQQSRPPQGRGRTDTFNPTKFNVFHLPEDHTIGTVDLPQVWNQQPRVGMNLHWDGNNNNITERNFAAAMAIGATPKTVIMASFKRVTDFLLGLKPPPYPFPIQKDVGRPRQEDFRPGVRPLPCVRRRQHGTGGTYRDCRHRPSSSRLFHRGTGGEVPLHQQPAIRLRCLSQDQWLRQRADRRHLGACTLLCTMARFPTFGRSCSPMPPGRRVFYRGYDVYDPKNVGFVSDGPEAQRAGFKVDTSVPGNGNQGHPYGTNLKDAEKWDLIEFLKTL